MLKNLVRRKHHMWYLDISFVSSLFCSRFYLLTVILLYLCESLQFNRCYGTAIYCVKNILTLLFLMTFLLTLDVLLPTLNFLLSTLDFLLSTLDFLLSTVDFYSRLSTFTLDFYSRLSTFTLDSRHSTFRYTQGGARPPQLAILGGGAKMKRGRRSHAEFWKWVGKNAFEKI
jgi:hypothetical protein